MIIYLSSAGLQEYAQVQCLFTFIITLNNKHMKNTSFRMFLMVSGMFFLLMLGGSIINFTLSVVFMESFQSIQCSPIWVFHILVILFFTVSIGAEMENE